MNRDAVDLRGLKCPLPALIARRHLERAKPGTIIRIVTDDPMAPIDIPHMCRSEGFEVLEVQTEGNDARISLRRP